MIQDLYNDSKEQAVRKQQGLDFTRMDSAFCNQNTIKACLDRGLFFTITANKATTFWHTELEKQGVDHSSESSKVHANFWAWQCLRPQKCGIGTQS
jgi:hypothetical protein